MQIVKQRYAIRAGNIFNEKVQDSRVSEMCNKAWELLHFKDNYAISKITSQELCNSKEYGCAKYDTRETKYV